MNNSTISLGTASTEYQCVFKGLDFRMDNLEFVYVSNIVASVLNATFAVTAITGNLLVLLAIWLTPLKRSPSNLLLSSLAFADLQVGLVVQPAFVAYKVAEIRGNSAVACYARFINLTFGYATTGVSLMTLTAIGIERYLALRLHMRYIEVVTRLRIMIYCGISWVIAVILVAIYFLQRSVFGAIIVLAEISSVLITTFAYVRVYKVVRRHQSDIQNQRRISLAASGGMQLNIKKYQRSTNTMFLVFMLSFICYAPYPAITVLLLRYGFTARLKIAVEMSATIICINSTLNPFIYCLKLREIRRAVFSILRKPRPGVYPALDGRSCMTFAPMGMMKTIHEKSIICEQQNSKNFVEDTCAGHQEITSL